MYLARVTFGFPSPSDDLAEVDDLVTAYLVSLRKNGQICGDFLHALCPDGFVAYTKLARPDAASRGYHSESGLEYLTHVISTFGKGPTWKFLENEVPMTFHDFRTSSFLFLFTSAFDGDSPICCGDTGHRVPTYLVPVTETEREDLFSWAGEYNHLDNIWLGSGELEIPAYQQLASLNSGLTQTGRQLAEKVEAALGIPTYYFLMRYFGRGKGEANRTCPGCNGQWLIQENLQAEYFWKFPFRCEKCRLVSQIADTDEDEELAHIGEFESKLQTYNPFNHKR
ncbi:MAG: DUF2310 family Zn-ribbon-containing protein [Acidobacteria bacterium]|nr:DUF2310 family Zn-ribbon-containing protein [Acidobacteriota bacterium]